MDSPLCLEIRIFSEVGNRLMELVFNGDWELKTGEATQQFGGTSGDSGDWSVNWDTRTVNDGFYRISVRVVTVSSLMKFGERWR